MVEKIIPKMVHFIVKENTWGSAVFVFIGDKKETSDFIKKRWNVDIANDIASNSGYYATLENNKTKKISRILWVNQFGVGILAHEILHLVKAILKHRGLGDMNDETEEAYAYLLEYFIKEITRKGYKLNAGKV